MTVLIVLAVYWPPQAPGPGQADVLDLVQLLEGDLAGAVRADRLVDRHDGRVALALVDARVDRPAVEDDAGDVEPAERHRRRRDGLVAGDEGHEPIEHLAEGHELHRVGDDLAADERGLHALGAHRHAVADGDRVELHRGAAGGPDAGLDVLRQPALVEVARHRLDPGRADPDDGLGEVLVGEADGLEHRPRAGPVGSVGDGRGVALGGVGGAVGVRHGVGLQGRDGDGGSSGWYRWPAYNPEGRPGVAAGGQRTQSPVSGRPGPPDREPESVGDVRGARA